MTENHPITPPPELVQQWMDLPLSEEERLRAAYRAGANRELEACIEYFHEYDASWGEHSDLVTGLRATRRPKPPSLKEQALDELHISFDRGYLKEGAADTIRRALEQLDD